MSQKKFEVKLPIEALYDGEFPEKADLGDLQNNENCTGAFKEETGFYGKHEYEGNISIFVEAENKDFAEEAAVRIFLDMDFGELEDVSTDSDKAIVKEMKEKLKEPEL